MLKIFRLYALQANIAVIALISLGILLRRGPLVQSRVLAARKGQLVSL